MEAKQLSSVDDAGRKGGSGELFGPDFPSSTS